MTFGFKMTMNKKAQPAVDMIMALATHNSSPNGQPNFKAAAADMGVLKESNDLIWI